MRMSGAVPAARDADGADWLVAAMRCRSLTRADWLSVRHADEGRGTSETWSRDRQNPYKVTGGGSAAGKVGWSNLPSGGIDGVGSLGVSQMEVPHSSIVNTGRSGF